MTENKNMEGVLVCSIPFTHPGHVPQILVYLRQQALFNYLIASCVRPMARQDPDTTILEISTLSWQHISVSVEHPYEETMATAELDLTDISALKCRLYGVGMTTTAEQASELSGRVLQRCLSIPLTMRILLKIWESNSLPVVISNLTSGAGGNGNYNLNLGAGGKDQTGQNGTASGMPDFTNGEPKIKQEPGLNNGNNGTMSSRQMQQQQQSSLSSHQLLQQQQQQSFLDAGTESSIGFPSYSGQSDTTTAMGAVTSNTSASMLNPLQLGALLGQAKNSLVGNSNERGKKARKRKSGTDGLWRSPKRKCDSGDSAAEILLESSSSENSTPLGTPTGRENFASETRTSTPTSATSLASGIDFSNLDATDILGTDKSTSDYDLDNSERDSEIMEMQHSGAEQQQDVEELIKLRESSSTRKSKKSRSGGGSGGSSNGEEKKSSPTNIFVDETSATSSNKTLPVPPSVSITPISCGNLDQTSSTNYNSVLTGMGLERRPGIEIIPIASSPSQTNLPSSITITPIAGPAPSSKTSGLTNTTEERQRSERKSSKSSGGKSGSEDNKSNKLEKRRKRKREDSPMGPPPDKIALSGKQQQQQQQQDPLSKPVSVSIKPSTEQSSPSGAGGGLSCSSRPTSPAAIRKFSPSPTHPSSLVTLVGKSSPTLKASQSAAVAVVCGGKPVQSPKHSPVYGSSPKHNTSNVPISMSVPMSLSVSTVPNTVGNVPSVAVSVSVPASASPKHGNTSSPKHGSSAASSGKPSMSALKSAANSPSSKSGSTSDTTTNPSKIKSSSASSSSKDSSSRADKEKRASAIGSSNNSASHQSPKTKSSSSSKLKQLEMVSPGSGTETIQISSLQSSSNNGGNTPPSSQMDAANKSAIAAQQAQARNRKSSLNAVIDKLKNAQHCSDSDTCGNGNSNIKSSSSSSVGNTGGLSNSGSSSQKEKNITGGNSSGSKSLIESGKSSCVTKNSSVDTKNPASEYMVKHSSDGIKITINKTRTKDSKQSAANLKLSSSSSSSATMINATSSSGSSSSVVCGPSSSSSSSSGGMVTGSNGSPKTHTGLKPGVTSGPASKKPQTLQTAQKLLPGKMLLGAGGIKSAISSSGTSGSAMSAVTASAVGIGGGNPLSKSGSSSKSSSSPKTSSSGATDLSRNRDKPRITKSGDKSVFASKGLADARKSSPSNLREESDSERAYKLLAAHASISNLPPSLPPQLMMEGLMKQLDTNFQIPKLSARANIADAIDKNKASDKLPMLPDSAKQTLDNLKQESNKIAGMSNIGAVSKSDDQSRREHAQVKPDNLSIVSSSGAMSLNLSGENAGNLMLPPQSAIDSEIPTNLCIQPIMDNESSCDSCKDLGMRQTSTSQQFLSKIDDAGGGILSKGSVSDQLASSAKTYAPMSSSTIPISSNSIVGESLNLSIKSTDQATLQTKYKIVADEKKQQTCGMPSSTSSSTLFSSMGSVSTTSDSNPSVVTTSDIGSVSGEQEVAAAAAAAEMLLDFSVASKDPMTKSHGLPLAQHHLTTIPERVMTQAALVVRRNTPPPPPPPPPAPFPPAASPSVSVHIVKSPAPSPRVIPPSPHSSASPCITDDELMDEALVGLGK